MTTPSAIHVAGPDAAAAVNCREVFIGVGRCQKLQIYVCKPLKPLTFLLISIIGYFDWAFFDLNYTVFATQCMPACCAQIQVHFLNVLSKYASMSCLLELEAYKLDFRANSFRLDDL